MFVSRRWAIDGITGGHRSLSYIVFFISLSRIGKWLIYRQKYSAIFRVVVGITGGIGV